MPVVPDICPREKSLDLMYDLSTKITTLATKSKDNFTTIFFGGSGTASVEAVIAQLLATNLDS